MTELCAWLASFEGGCHSQEKVCWMQTCLTRLKSAGQTIIVIDKHIGSLLKLADVHFVVEKGRVVWSGTSESLRSQPELLHQYVGV